MQGDEPTWCDCNALKTTSVDRRETQKTTSAKLKQISEGVRQWTPREKRGSGETSQKQSRQTQNEQLIVKTKVVKY